MARPVRIKPRANSLGPDCGAGKRLSHNPRPGFPNPCGGPVVCLRGAAEKSLRSVTPIARRESKSRTAPATYLDGPRQCHVGGMVLGHPHADATYRIVPRDRAYGVEVSIPNSNPTMVTSFA